MHKQKGSSPPYILIICCIIGVLFYLFGWMVLAFVVGLMLLIAAATAIYDRVSHDKNCKECIHIKRTLADHYGIDADSIKTKHEKYFDTNMDVTVFLGENKTLLVNIEYLSTNFTIIKE